MPPLNPKAGHLGLILPLATSSATLGLALFQFPILNAFLARSPPTTTGSRNNETATAATNTHSIAGRPLSLWWPNFVAAGAPLLGAFAATSSLSGLGIAYWLRAHATLETTHVSTWYVAGAVLSLAHLAFVPLVAGPLQGITNRGQEEAATATAQEEKVDAENREDIKNWLQLHMFRIALVDVPALVCFAEGVALSFWVTH